MSRCRLLLAGALLGGVATAADNTPFTQCAAVDDPAARLACYDALAGRAAATPGPALPAAVPAPPAAPSADEFGKASSQTTMTARIAGTLKEWRRGTLFQLDNGQVWQCVDDSTAYYPDLPENAEVEIIKGATGYKLEIKTIRRKVGVKRIS